MESEKIQNLKSKLVELILRIDNETTISDKVLSAFLEYSPKNRNPFLQETLFKPLNQTQNVDCLTEFDLDNLMEISFGRLWQTGIGRKKILENPHFFAHRQCRLEQAKEKVLEKFKDLGREDLEKILNFVLHILKTTRNVMDFTEMIAENDELDMDLLGQIFGRTDILVAFGPIDSMILCQCENWNNVNEPFGVLNNFNEWKIRPSCRKIRRENVTLHIGSGYVVKSTDLCRRVRRSFKDSAYVEATVHRYLQNEYESSRYQFTGPCPFINKFLGCTQPENGKKIRIISETHIDFFDTLENKYSRNYGSCKQNFWSQMKSSDIPQSEWGQHTSPWEEFIAVPAIQSLLGLYYMHKMGIVHRDFKMENLVGNADGTEVKIIDFALCKMFGPECETARCSECVGTPGYMAPEVIACGEGSKARKSREMLSEFDGTYDGKAADVWSWGDMIICMLLFEDPFIALDNTDKIFRIVTSDSYMKPELRNTSKYNIRGRMGLKPTKKTWMVSDDLCDLLSIIFVPEKERATIDDILNHSWVQKHLEKFHDKLVQPLNFSIPLNINSNFNTYEEENCIILTTPPSLGCTLNKTCTTSASSIRDTYEIMQDAQQENKKMIKSVATFTRQDHCLNTRITSTNAAAAGATCSIRGGPATSSSRNSIMINKKKKFILQTVMIKVDEDSDEASMGGDEYEEMEESSEDINMEYVERGSSDLQNMVIKSASDSVVEREDLNIFPLVLDQHQQLGLLPLVMTISSSLGFSSSSPEVVEEEEIGGGDMEFYEEFVDLPDIHEESIAVVVEEK